MKGFVALVLAAALVGCSSDEPSEETAPHAVCGGLCGAAERCLGPSYNHDCPTVCASDPSLLDISVDGAKQLGGCVANVSCATLADETSFNAAYDDCWQQAKARVPVRQYVRDVCVRYTLAWFECGSSVTTGECESDLDMWADTVVKRAAACLDTTSCTDLDSCIAAAFGGS